MCVHPCEPEARLHIASSVPRVADLQVASPSWDATSTYGLRGSAPLSGSGGLPPEFADAKFLLLVDRESGGALGVTLFDTEEAMRKGDEAMNAGPGNAVSRSSVEFYEPFTPFDLRQSSSARGHSGTLAQPTDVAIGSTCMDSRRAVGCQAGTGAPTIRPRFSGAKNSSGRTVPATTPKKRFVSSLFVRSALKSVCCSTVGGASEANS